MTKKELRAAIARFMADNKKVVSQRLLCELAGISADTFQNVFVNGKTELTVTTQLRLEKALLAIERGEVVVTQKHDQTRHISYRRRAEPEFRRGFTLTLKNGGIGIKTGLQNVNSYRGKTFLEELEG